MLEFSFEKSYNRTRFIIINQEKIEF